MCEPRAGTVAATTDDEALAKRGMKAGQVVTTDGDSARRPLASGEPATLGASANRNRAGPVGLLPLWNRGDEGDDVFFFGPGPCVVMDASVLDFWVDSGFYVNCIIFIPVL